MSAPSGALLSGALLGLYAQTSVHAGAGTGVGTVDRPIQREPHTLWPTLAASTLTGALRAAVRTRLALRDDLDALPRWDDTPSGTRAERAAATLEFCTLFGPPTEGPDRTGGALSVTDARLLCFPVRSLRGGHAWVTCPAALERLRRDAELAGHPAGFALPPAGAALPDNRAVVAPDSACLVGGDQLVLEEFQFTCVGDQAGDSARWIAETLLPGRAAYEPTRARFHKHFVILGDNDFGHFAQHATEVVARRARAAGTVAHQEFLPPETLLYAVALADPARATALLASLTDHLGDTPVLQIGGDATTGKGHCACRLAHGSGGTP